MAVSNTPQYTPSPPTIAPQTEDGRNLAAWVQQQLEFVAQQINKPTRQHVEPIARAPVTPRVGDIVLNDGTNWNPLGHATGSKQSLMVYRNAGVFSNPAWVQADVGPLLIDDDGLIQIQSSVSNRPFIDMVNTANDAVPIQLNYAKSRNIGNTLANDIILEYQFLGYANGNYQGTAAIQVQQVGASVGSNIASQIIFFTSDTTGQFNHFLTIDSSGDLVFQVSALKQVAVPNNANAAAAGVSVGGLYTTTADPHIVYIRTT